MDGSESATEAVMLQAAGLQRRLRDAIERCPSHAITRDGRKERELLVTVGCVTNACARQRKTEHVRSKAKETPEADRRRRHEAEGCELGTGRRTVGERLEDGTDETSGLTVARGWMVRTACKRRVNLENLEMRIIDYHEYEGPLTDDKVRACSPNGKVLPRKREERVVNAERSVSDPPYISGLRHDPSYVTSVQAKVLRGIDEARNELIRSAKDGLKCSTRGGALFQDILEFVEGSGEEEEDRSMPEFDVQSPVGTPLEKDKLLKGAQATRWDAKEGSPSLKSSFEASPTSVLSDDGILEQTNNYGNGPIFKRQLFRDEDLEDERGVLGAYNWQSRPADNHAPGPNEDEQVVPQKETSGGKKKASIAGRILSWLVAGGVTWAAFTVFSMADKTKRPPGLWTAKVSSPKRTPQAAKRQVKKEVKAQAPAVPKRATPAPAAAKAKKGHPKVSVKERKGSKPRSTPSSMPAAPPSAPVFQPPASTVTETKISNNSPPAPAIMGPGPAVDEAPDISVFLGRG